MLQNIHSYTPVYLCMYTYIALDVQESSHLWGVLLGQMLQWHFLGEFWWNLLCVPDFSHLMLQQNGSHWSRQKQATFFQRTVLKGRRHVF